jgi:hypothetical protein
MRRGTERTLVASDAFRFVLTMRIVNLFADMTYEARGCQLSLLGDARRRRRRSQLYRGCGRIPRL